MATCPVVEQCLARNGQLPGNAKYVLLPHETTLRLRAEIPLERQSQIGAKDLSARIQAACAGMAAALSAAAGSTPNTSDKDAEKPLPLDLAALLEEAGWPRFERRHNRFQVDLDVMDCLCYRASVERQADHVRLWVGLAPYEEDGPSTVRRALSALLLRAGSSVRMARGAIRPTQQALAAGFDVVLPGACTAAELGHGLCALSVACELFGREAEALAEDDALARRYLSLCFG
jgi:hypothetical protein